MREIAVRARFSQTFGLKFPAAISGSERWRAKGNAFDAMGLANEMQGVDFALPRGAKARTNLCQRCVLVARMSDQLPASVGHCSQQIFQRGAVERTGRKHADSSVRGGEAFLRDDAMESATEELECAELGKPSQRNVLCGALAPVWLEGIADAMDAGAPCRSQDRAQDGRELVQVFVGVDVGERESGLLQTRDLGKGFGFEEVFALTLADAVRKKRT